MNAATVHISRESVLAYGRAAQECFNAIHSELKQLVDDSVDVTYYGQQGVLFKTKCGQLASDFANGLSTDVRSIGEAVQRSTTAIREALGGDPVTIQFDGATIPVPAVPPSDDAVGVDEGALESLKGVLASHFARIQQQFDDHLAKLRATDWRGTAKDNAVDAVSRFTTTAKSKVDEANNNLATYIDQQLEAVRASNR